MGRFYTVSASGLTVSAAEDLFEILAVSGKPFVLHKLSVSQSSDFGDLQAEGLQLRLKRATSGYTTGSGGSTVTPAKHQTSDAAFGGTAKAGNTAAAVAGAGTLTTLLPESFNEQAGWEHLPTPEARYVFAAGEAMILSCPSTPADSLTVDVSAVIEELC